MSPKTKRVLELRRQHLPYAAISAQVDMPTRSVKWLCEREGVIFPAGWSTVRKLPCGEALHLWRQGYTLGAIAERYSVTISAVHRAIHGRVHVDADRTRRIGKWNSRRRAEPGKLCVSISRRSAPPSTPGNRTPPGPAIAPSPPCSA